MLYKLDQVRKLRSACSHISTKAGARSQVTGTYKYVWGGAVSEKGGAVNNLGGADNNTPYVDGEQEQIG